MWFGDVFFCLQVDGPITGGLISGRAYKWQFTVVFLTKLDNNASNDANLSFEFLKQY